MSRLKDTRKPKRRAAGLWGILLLVALAWPLVETGPGAPRAGHGGTAEEILRHKYPEPPLALPRPNLPPTGGALVRARGCLACHRLGEEGARAGVDLSRAGRRYGAESIERLLRHPRQVNPDATMPDPQLTRAEALIIADFLARLR